MTLESQIFIFYANRYDFPAEDGKGRISGTKIHYLDSTDMSPINEIDAKDFKGRRSGNAVIDYNMLAKMPYVPGIYDASFETATDSKGNLALKVTDIKPVSPCQLSSVKVTK